MTLRIERRRSGDTLVVQLVGELDVEHRDEVKAQVNDAACAVVVDIGELTLISVEGIRFLNACHENGMPRQTLESKLRRLGIKPYHFRTS
jgi:anti-anti-sigma regulatory factor